MQGLGTIVNSAAIFVGSLLGILLKRGLPERWQQTIMSGIALSIVIIGVQMALKTNDIVIVIISLALGSVIGEIMDIEKRLENLGGKIGSLLTGGNKTAADSIAEGFVNASVLFCSGAMSIVGSIQDGLSGDHTTLFAKAAIDGLIALVFSSQFGLGVMFSSVSVGLYQGFITMISGSAAPFITREILAEITASGGILIMAIGTNMLHITKIRIGNMVPGMLVAAVLAGYFM